jgi:hypothetical protein
MGCCSSSSSGSSSADGDEFKILLLGPAASGKSTFAKQMRVLYSGGFDSSETGLYRDALIAGLLEGFQDCFIKAEDEALKIKDEAVRLPCRTSTLQDGFLSPCSSLLLLECGASLRLVRVIYFCSFHCLGLFFGKISV